MDAFVLGGALIVALVLYFLFGGADFGGGIWGGFAAGPRKERQQALVSTAIGPIWEANHVWLILAVVILFSAFPPAFAAISIAFHIPLTLLLLGIVFRGSAFAFQSLDTGVRTRQQGWGRVFGLASLVAPLLLGMIVGGVSSGKVTLHPDGYVLGGWFAPWTQPFSIACGLLALALCAYLAATYLAYEARLDPVLSNDFRLRALASAIAVGACALAAFLLSAEGAPQIRAGLTRNAWTGLLHLSTGLFAVGAFVALLHRRYATARFLAMGQTTLIVVGWAASMYPYLLVPSLTYTDAAAKPASLRLLVILLAIGVPVLLPCLYVLFRVFKGEKAFAVVDRPDDGHNPERGA